MDEKKTVFKVKKQSIKSQTSVSFSKDHNETDLGLDERRVDDDDDDIQISLAPYIQVYLAQSNQHLDCCGLHLPTPFERAASRSWWDPRFDSEILEGQYKLSAFPQIRLRFRYSLLYIFIVCLFWTIYLTYKTTQEEENGDSFASAIIFGSFSIFILIVLAITKSNLYSKFHLHISVITAITMFALSLVSVGALSVLTPVGEFSLCIEILMIIYTVIPLPLYICVLFGISYSILFECFMCSIFPMPVRILCHICVHLIGIHILIMTNVRMRGTFMKVGQSLLVRRQLEMEKQLKEKMIYSVMPPKVADWLMLEGAGSGREEETHTLNGDIRSIFRPFNMHRMENVSILFADIVGFTKMSSTKTAEELVAILNHLFERFDELCTAHGCEKISTLGDCYYCVSGCPEPRPDHAECCLEMGLGMISVIAQFEQQSREGVNMRVGVHTGTVLCGIVGTKRVKFDVWSNDVTLANKMESTGKPGMVHLSDKTVKYLEDKYIFEEGDSYQGLKTFFVTGRKNTEEPTEGILLPPSSMDFPGGNQPRRSSISLATAISIHVNKTAALEEVLNSSQNFCARTPSPEEPGSPTHGQPTRCRSPIHRVLNLSRSWKTTSLPSILDTEGNDQSDVISIKEEYFFDRKGSSSLTKKKTNQKLVYEKVPTSVLSEPEYPATDLLDAPENPFGNVQDSLVRDDQKSVCLSMNSRKDSGIRSNSRKSSIQPLAQFTSGVTTNDLLSHRVSGYYTSSQSSVNNEQTIKMDKLMSTSTGDQYGVCFQKLRKQSDIQLIKCVQDNSLSQRSYFVKPPLHSISLCFCQQEMEQEYRLKAHRSCKEEASTLATARFNTHLDIAVTLLVFLLTSVTTLFLFGISSELRPYFLLLCIVQIFALLLCLRSVFWPEYNSSLDRFSKWYSWHLIGGVLVSLPTIVILLSIDEAFKSLKGIYYFTSLFLIGLIHFCNFTQLNCWMKSTVATVAGIVFLVIFNTFFHSVHNSASSLSHSTSFPQSNVPVSLMNFSDIYPEDFFKRNQSAHFLGVESNPLVTKGNVSSYLSRNKTNIHLHHIGPFFIRHSGRNDTSVVSSTFEFEIFLDILLILLLVWFLNREFEISFRLSFHGNIVAARDKAKMQTMKDQAEVLLHNIIPKHVAEQLKITARYSENVQNAGIIFASIINFSDMYDESYLGGLECLRVLNELVSDFDELLNQPEFASVDKIKTIGSTYMAASGLNPINSDGNHLHTLMDFALRLQAAVDAFNKDLLSFNLILRIGYNFGDVTAGVIGTTKLFYDIWGDAVNIASRMDSTGVAGRVQLPAHCVPALLDKYSFEQRGQVYVKGKDNMSVYLLVGRK